MYGYSYTVELKHRLKIISIAYCDDLKNTQIRDS